MKYLKPLELKNDWPKNMPLPNRERYILKRSKRDQILDAFKMAWVGFAEEMKWDYHVKLSTGTSFSRTTLKIKEKK